MTAITALPTELATMRVTCGSVCLLTWRCRESWLHPACVRYKVAG